MTSFSNPMSTCNLQQQSQANYPFMTNGPRVYEQLSLNPTGSYLTNSSSHHHHHHHSHAAAAAAAAAVAAQQHHNNQRANCQIPGYGNVLQQAVQQGQQPQQTNLNTSTSGRILFDT
jgi:hypothetical protein